jgi:exosortase
MSNDQYSHIILIPAITGALFCFDRRDIFTRETGYSAFAVIPMGLFLTALYFSANSPRLSEGGYELAVTTCCAVWLILSGFLLCFGQITFRRALFPLCFLCLMIPVPQPLMKPIVRFLQDGSAAVSAMLFRLIQLPALRQGLIFALPGFDIEIAEQCSGIRSSTALFIAAILAGHFFLRSVWRRALVTGLTIPLVIFKNALRIVTISALGLYVSPDFLHGKLHHYSGIPFSIVEMLIVAPLLLRWHSVESRLTKDFARRRSV